MDGFSTGILRYKPEGYKPEGYKPEGYKPEGQDEFDLESIQRYVQPNLPISVLNGQVESWHAEPGPPAP